MDWYADSCQSGRGATTFMRCRPEMLGMSKATQVVVGTVGISAVLAAALAVGILLA